MKKFQEKEVKKSRSTSSVKIIQKEIKEEYIVVEKEEEKVITITAEELKNNSNDEVNKSITISKAASKRTKASLFDFY